MLISKLNKEQEKAVKYNKNPLLIVAGAGTGKTTVLTNKIVYLIEQNKAKPEEILALTFTDKAALEMEERVDIMLPFGYYDLWISTFHSFCERVLADWGLDIGIPNNFKLLNETGGWILVKKNFDRFNFLDYYKPLGNPTKFIQALISHFAKCKDEGIYPNDYLEYADSLKLNFDDASFGPKKAGIKEIKESSSNYQEYQRASEVAQAYHVYQNLLLENSALDFGDLINYTIKLFRKRRDILKKFQKKFKYILVDEFQDTNWVQYDLVKMLAGENNNISVCADDDQSIFSFQGASFNNVLRFKSDYPKSKEIVLVENYRSTQNILDLSYNFIQLNNPNRLEFQLNTDNKLKERAKEKKVDLKKFKKINKKLKSNLKERGKIELLTFKTGEGEIGGVVNKIWQIKEIDKNAKFSDFAILARTNGIANNFAKGLEKSGLPYNFLASKGLYSNPIILELISYFRLLINFYDSSNFYRVLGMTPLNLSLEEVSLIMHYCSKKGISVFEGINKPSLLNSFSKDTRSKLTNLLENIKKHSKLAKEYNITQVFVIILEDLGYLKYLAHQNEESFKDTEIIDQFYKRVKEFEEIQFDGKLQPFLEELQMEIDSGEEGVFKYEFDEDCDAVNILTIHSAKGLEFKYVFIVNLVNLRFPTIHRRDPIQIPPKLVREILPEGDFHLQEERRLFYVALTRSKKGLFLSWAKDYGGKLSKKPSRFLIESGLIKKEDINKNNNIPQKINFSFINENNKKIDLSYRENKRLSLPDHFSYSQIAAFSKCPLQYKYAHILKIPTRGKATFSFGKTIHNTLYRFLNSICNGCLIDQKDLFGNSHKTNKSPEYDDLIQIYKKEWIDDWYHDSLERKDYYKKGKQNLKIFFNDYMERKPTILFLDDKPALEKIFKLKLNGDNFVGAIDRIDQNKGEIEILDYKTGNPKDKLTPQDKLQLLIYQLVSFKVFNLTPSKLTYYYLDNGSQFSFMPSHKEIEKTEKDIIERIKRIKNSNFAPSPGIQCNFCDFKDICPYRKF